MSSHRLSTNFFFSFPRKFWTSLPTLTELDRKVAILRENAEAKQQQICGSKCETQAVHLLRAKVLYKLTPYNGGYEISFFLDCRKFQLNPTSFFGSDTDPSVPKHENPCKSGFPSSGAHKTHLLVTQSNSEYSVITFHTLTNTDQINILLFLEEKSETRWNYSTEWEGCTAGTRTQSFISAPPLFSSTRQLLNFIVS